MEISPRRECQDYDHDHSRQYSYVETTIRLGTDLIESDIRVPFISGGRPDVDLVHVETTIKGHEILKARETCTCVA